MKNRLFITLLSIISLGILLSGCSNANATNSWGNAAVSDDNVVFTNSGSVIAVSSVNGSVRWTYPEKSSTARLFFASPVISEQDSNGDRQVLIGDYSGLLVSISMQDGVTENWRFDKAQGKYIASPVIIGNVVVAPNTDGFIYFLKMTEGQNGWTIGDVKSFPAKADLDKKGVIKNALGAFWATPAHDAATIYAPSLDHYLYAVDLASGVLKWKVDLGGPIVAAPLLADDGTLFIGTLNSTLFALDSNNQGKVIWKQSMPGGIWSKPILKDEQLFIGDQSGKINILQASDGKIIQSIDGDSAILGTGVMVGDSLVFGNEAGDLTAIDATGGRVWARSINGKIYSNLVFGGGDIYVIVTKGDEPIYAFDTNGNQLPFYKTSK